MKEIIKDFNQLYNNKEQNFPYRYLIVWSMSSRSIGLTEKILPDLKFNEITEYRCFDEDGEVHGLLTPEGFVISIIDDKLSETSDNFDDNFEQEFELVDSSDSFGDTLIMKKYIKYDEDGQGCITASRCYGFTMKGGR